MDKIDPTVQVFGLSQMDYESIYLFVIIVESVLDDECHAYVL